MKKNFAVIFLCFLAGLAGGNVAPILTGSGYIKFPETSPSASISALGGTMALQAGGTSQHVLLLPSSGGGVGVNTTDPTFTNTLGHAPGLGVVSTSTPILAGYSSTQPAFALNVDSTGYWILYDHAAGAWALGILQTGGRIGLGVSPNAAYRLDVAGDTNTSGVFRVGGTAGLSIVKTIRNSANSGTCTITFTGGLMTASTC